MYIYIFIFIFIHIPVWFSELYYGEFFMKCLLTILLPIKSPGA